MGLVDWLLDWLAGPPPKPLPEDPEGLFWDKLRPLGEFRWRVLRCVGDFDKTVREQFDPDDPASLREALRRYLQGYWDREVANAKGPQFNCMALFAAGLATFGNLPMIEFILANLPPEPIEMDHGCGWCNVLAFRIAAHLLPLPRELNAYMEWYEGSPTGERVRKWFAIHREHLIWNGTSGRFDLLNELTEE